MLPLLQRLYLMLTLPVFRESDEVVACPERLCVIPWPARSLCSAQDGCSLLAPASVRGEVLDTCTYLESALSDVGTTPSACPPAPRAFCWGWHLLGVLVFTFLM